VAAAAFKDGTSHGDLEDAAFTQAVMSAFPRELPTEV
jgi:hypothetical protein